jgi:hypothetical protein
MPLSAGRKQIGLCMRCGFKYARAALREDGRLKKLLVCASCWDPDHPLDYPAPPRAEGLPPMRPSPDDGLGSFQLTAEQIGLAVILAWTPARPTYGARYEGYRVMRSVDGADFVELVEYDIEYSTFGAVDESTEVLGYIDLFLDSGHSYAYRIDTFASDDSSISTNTETFITEEDEVDLLRITEAGELRDTEEFEFRRIEG